MNEYKKDFLKLDEISRRKFLHYLAKSTLGVGLASVAGSPFLQASATGHSPQPRARNVIYIYLAGGMSHLDTFDPKSPRDIAGPVGSINTNVAGIKVTEWLPNLARQMDKIALIRSLKTTQGAHEPGAYYMRTSYEQRGSISHPGIGSWLMHLSGKTNSTLPGNIRIGGSNNMDGGAGFLDTKLNPLHVGDPSKGLDNAKPWKNVSQEEFNNRIALAEWMDLNFHKKYQSKKTRAYSDAYEDAIKLMNSEDLAAFDIAKEPQTVREQYGDSTFGKGCMLARRLVENGVRFVEVTKGGWDTHDDNFNRVQELSIELDLVLSTLIEDLYLRGLLEETLVVVATEFGRTPKINTNEGRDHHPKAFTCLMAGGGVQGGIAYGATDKTGEEVTEDLVTVPDFNATIAYALGLPTEKVIYSPSGRPFTVAHKGHPITALF